VYIVTKTHTRGRLYEANKEQGEEATIHMSGLRPKYRIPIEGMVEGAVLTCPFCKLTLTLHGHMLEDVQREIKKLEDLA